MVETVDEIKELTKDAQMCLNQALCDNIGCHDEEELNIKVAKSMFARYYGPLLIEIVNELVKNRSDQWEQKQ